MLPTVSLQCFCRQVVLGEFHALDNNSEQTFAINPTGSSVTKLKLTFTTSSDFFGRITIYKLDVLGRRV